MCWRAGGTAKWSGVRMGGARAGGSKTGFVCGMRDVCGCVLCVLCVCGRKWKWLLRLVRVVPDVV